MLALVWLTAIPLVGLLLSIKFHNPEFMGGLAWWTFGRLRPVHVNGVIFGSFTTTFLGLLYYYVPKLCGQKNSVLVRFGGDWNSPRINGSAYNIRHFSIRSGAVASLSGTSRPMLQVCTINFIRRYTMTMPGIPSGGYKTVGQIDGTQDLRFPAKQSGLAIARELLSSHTPGAPIVDDTGKFIGFVSAFDLIGAIESGKDLRKVTADQIMNKEHSVVDESTTISNAVELMKQEHLLLLPVIKQGKVAYSLTRHDLLRARMGKIETDDSGQW